MTSSGLPPPTTPAPGAVPRNRDDAPAGDIRLPLTDHLTELRNRLVRSLLAWGIGASLCYSQAEVLFGALLRPVTVNLPPGGHLIFTELTEAFLTYFKVALLGGFVLASPVISFQAWRFVSPGLYRKEKKVIFAFSLWSTGAFLAGMAFGHFVAIPAIFSFLMSFGRQVIVPMPSMKEALSLVLRLLLIFGVMFELPLALFLGGRAGLLSPDFLRKGRKIALVAILVLGAVLTPPDAVSQIMVSVPLYALYEVGILLCAMGRRRHARGATRS